MIENIASPAHPFSLRQQERLTSSFHTIIDYQGVISHKLRYFQQIEKHPLKAKYKVSWESIFDRV